MQKKNLIALCLITLIVLILGIILYFQFFPIYTNISPSNYFSKDISWNTSVSQFNGLLHFNMQETPSMLPTIPYGASILVAPPNKMGKVQVGNIIAFYHPASKNLLAHRIIKIRGGKYLTKGDNVKYDDGYWLKYEEIKGKVVGILY